jgi:hypothetical protein
MNPPKKTAASANSQVPPTRRPDSKLLLLQFHDPNRKWLNLNDSRICILCGSELNGHSIRIGIERGRPAFYCPSEGCQGRLAHFAIAGNPLLNEEVWQDWMQSPFEIEREQAREETVTEALRENRQARPMAAPDRERDWGPAAGRGIGQGATR